MTWQPKTVRNYFKSMNEALDDLVTVFTFDALCLQAGITETEFDEKTEPYKETEWFIDEYNKLFSRLKNIVINHGVKHPGSAAMCQSILKNFYGIGDGAVENQNYDKIEFVETIITKHPDAYKENSI